jgi:hypothetical protein
VTGNRGASGPIVRSAARASIGGGGASHRNHEVFIMGLIPDKRLDKIQFFQGKITPWSASAVAIGTTAGAVTDLQTKTDAAAAAVIAQEEARAASETATATADAAIAAMVSAGADIIKQIRTKAATSADPNTVYNLAQIPAPAAPTPVGPLGTPDNFTVGLSPSGAVILKWKCTNPKSATGVTYQIWRRNGPTEEFTYLGGTGAKEYQDNTVPAGSSQVTYQIQATRSNSVGEWAQCNVNFGVSGASMTASVEPTTPQKIAA